MSKFQRSTIRKNMLVKIIYPSCGHSVSISIFTSKINDCINVVTHDIHVCCIYLYIWLIFMVDEVNFIPMCIDPIANRIQGCNPPSRESVVNLQQYHLPPRKFIQILPLKFRIAPKKNKYSFPSI